MAKAWERRKGESGAAFQAFCLYRDLPYSEEPTSRSLSKVGQRLGKSTALMARWSTAHEWQERCREYDNELQREELEGRKLEVKAMRREHIGLARQMTAKARAALEELKPARMKPREITAMMKAGADLERRAMNEGLADLEGQDARKATSTELLFTAIVKKAWGEDGEKGAE